jgi:tetrahydromethanopterin S-methyltransferase subunit G
LNSENSSGPEETGAQSQGSESSVARPLGSEAASGQGSAATSARDKGQAKAAIGQIAQPSVEAEKNPPAWKVGRDHEIGGSVAVAPFDGAAVDPLKEASAALDDRDYATAQRLFAAVGRKDVAEAIKDLLAALDGKDYAKAQGLFEALGQKGAAAPQVKGSAPASPAPPQPATSAGGPTASDSQNKIQQKSVISPLEVIPLADAAYRRPQPQAEKAKSRRLRPLLLGTLMLFAIFGVSAIYGSPLNWTFPTTKGQAIAGLSSGAHILKADLEAIMGQTAREDGRSATPDPSATLTQLTDRLDQIEHEYGARLDKLSERVDQDSSSRFADIAARLDKLEKKVALAAAPPASESADVVARLDKLEKKVAVAAAPPASESADVVARLDKLEKKVAVAAAPSSEIAGLTTRLNKLEKRAVVAGASSANPLPPAAPKQSSLMARVDPSAPNESARSDNPAPLLRDYSVEDARDGIAVVDSRSGPQEVAPGDFIPGAGRVLRIEKRGDDWFVLTSRGVIGSGPAP